MNPALPFPSDDDLPLLTDLYQITMAAGYFAEGIHERRAVFELFVRRLPPDRSFLLFAGLEQLIECVARLRFRAEDIAYLRELPALGRVAPAFFDCLAQLCFTGDVHALPEGTVCFANEPMVRVSAGLLEAQLLESIAINAVNFPTAVATKAARVCMAARGRPVVDFGMRRAAGPQASVLSARAALIGGCATTSNIAAARLFGCEPAGTMAHSWIMAHDDETEAFRRFAAALDRPVTALVDTYDVAEGVRRAAALGERLAAVRLDSGDLAGQARQARRILDEAGCRHAKIIASGDLNEHRIDDVLTAGAPIDGFGVGTELATVPDGPALAIVYKLVEVEGPDGVMRPVAKRSHDKATVGWAKQVYRVHEGGYFQSDTLTRADCPADGAPQLEPVVLGGRVVAPRHDLARIAAHAASQLACLPGQLRGLRGSGTYPVIMHESLQTGIHC